MWNLDYNKCDITTSAKNHSLISAPYRNRYAIRDDLNTSHNDDNVKDIQTTTNFNLSAIRIRVAY